MTVTAASAARAQDEVEVPPEHGEERVATPLPLRLTERPLTLPRGKISVSSSVGVILHRPVGYPDAVCASDGIVLPDGTECLEPIGRPNRTSAGSDSGFAIGVVEAFEVGMTPIAYRSGVSAVGDTELYFLDPELSLRAAALSVESFQMGFEYRLSLPLRSSSTVLAQRLRMDFLYRSPIVRLVASGYADFHSPVRDSFASGTLVSPGVDLGIVAQVAEPVALFLSVRNYFFDARREGHLLSLRAGVVGSIRRPDRQALADLAFAFDASNLIHREAGLTSGGIAPPAPTPTPVRLYTFVLSATFYFHDGW